MTTAVHCVEGFEPGAGAGDATVGAAQRGRARVEFAAFYADHHEAVFVFLCRRTGDSHAAEDLAAEVFVTAMRKWRRAPRGGAPARAWLLRVASFQANHWARGRARRMKRERAAAPAEAVRVRGADAAEQEAERVQRALLRLPARQQHVLGLFYFAEMSVEQIARVEGVSEGTVKSRLSRAREAMRAQLNGRSGGDERTA